MSAQAASQGGVSFTTVLLSSSSVIIISLVIILYFTITSFETVNYFYETCKASLIEATKSISKLKQEINPEEVEGFKIKKTYFGDEKVEFKSEDPMACKNACELEDKCKGLTFSKSKKMCWLTLNKDGTLNENGLDDDYAYIKK